MIDYKVRVIDKKPYLCDSLTSPYCVEILAYEASTDTFIRKNDCKVSAKIVPKETIRSILKGFV